MKNVSPDKKLIGMGNLIEFSREIFAKIAEKWKFMNFSQDGKKIDDEEKLWWMKLYATHLINKREKRILEWNKQLITEKNFADLRLTKPRLGKLFPFTDALAEELNCQKCLARIEGLSSNNYAKRYRFISHKSIRREK